MPKPYRIESVKRYTDNVKLFVVKCKDIKQFPGTFFEVTVPGIGECPLASCSWRKGYLDILVRNAGRVTAEIFKLTTGDTLWIRGHYGKGFPLPKLKNKNLIMVAGGTGIAPITSMIDYVEQHRRDFAAVWIYLGFRDEEHMLLKERIKKWKKLFHVHVGLSDGLMDTYDYERGFVQEIMERHKPPLRNVAALLCGPEGMMECVTNELNSLGLLDNKIYWSMERRMECAFGSCGRCLIQDLYCCKDGPVFRYDVIKPRIENEKFSNEHWSKEDET